MLFSKGKKRAVSLLLLLSLLGAVLSGCAGPAQGQEGTEDTATQKQAEGSQQSKEESENTAMGRYIEKSVDLSELSDYNSGLFRMSDGSLKIRSIYDGILVSDDNAGTWSVSDTKWYQELMQKEAYIMHFNMAEDGTAGVVCNLDEETAEEDPGEEISEENSNAEDSEKAFQSELNPQCYIYKPDGTKIHASVQVTEEDVYPCKIWFKGDGRIFVSTLGNNIYEVYEDGTSEKLFTAEERPELMTFVGERIIYDGCDSDGLHIYDLAAGQHMEDQVLNDFVNEYYADRDTFMGNSWFDLYFFAGREENVLYLAGKQGLHRHVLEGGSVEQVIDGKLSSLSNPSNGIASMVALENNEFVVLFSSAKIVRFTYDPNVPTIPDETLKVYSLRENDTLRQAVTLYQTANPEVFVQYEVGMEKDDSVTREDALKKLNTQIMAGEGPDLLVLDEMPLDSYMEKGLLKDLSGILNSLSGEAALFENIANTFKEGDAVYAVPCEYQLPVIEADRRYTSQMKDLKSIADTIEQIRADNEGKELLKIYSEKGMIRLLSLVCAPAWKTESGEINKEAIEEFLVQAKRIYDAEIDGIEQETIDNYTRISEQMLQEYGWDRDDYNNVRSSSDPLSYTAGYIQLIMRSLSYEYAYAELTSVLKTDGFKDNEIIPMNGQSCNVYWPRTIAGIRASSQSAEQAEEFLRLLLGKESQTSLFYGFSVNKAAFEENFTINEGDVDSNGVYGAISMSNDEGLYVELNIYWVNQEQIDTLKQWTEAADTPYVYDPVMEEAVCTAGVNYIRGDQTLEEAMRFIEEKTAIYMAE